MREVTATDIRNHFEEFLDIAREEPVGIRKLGKLCVVMMPAATYDHLRKIEDAYWIARAAAAEASGEWLSHDEATKVLTEGLKRPE
jgi:prevent-host-death family protein